MTQKISYEKNWPNLVEMFFNQVDSYHKHPLFHQQSDTGWKKISWDEAAQMVKNIAFHLKKIGIKPQDRIMIISENRFEWGLIDIAIMSIGAITVPAYITNTTSDHQHIIEDSGAIAAFISNQELLKKFLPAALNTQKMHSIITLDDVKITQNPGLDLYHIQSFYKNAPPASFSIQNEIKQIKGNHLACLIYTSGTGGAPKGVMLEHHAILQNIIHLSRFFAYTQKRSLFSILPLSHAFEHTAFLACIAYKIQIYYPQKIDNLLAGLQEKKPGILIAVPRIFEMLKTRTEIQLKKSSPKAQKAYNNALKLGLKLVHKKKLNLWEKIQYVILKQIIQRKIQKKFGNVEMFVSGGAPLDPHVGKWLMAMGFPLIQGYGQTEAAPVISANYLDHSRYDTVGPQLDNIDIKLGDGDELLIKGPNLMRGYWNNPQATSETIINGWLHTGDLARIEKDNHIVITGRKKDIIILSGGDNISPLRVENLLTSAEEISQAVVYGDQKNHLVAIIVPDYEWLKKWRIKNNGSPHLDEIDQDKKLHACLMQSINNINKNIPVVEKIRKIIISPQIFSIENGLLTPTLKVRRHIIIEKYKSSLDALYNKSNSSPL